MVASQALAFYDDTGGFYSDEDCDAEHDPDAWAVLDAAIKAGCFDEVSFPESLPSPEEAEEMVDDPEYAEEVTAAIDRLCGEGVLCSDDILDGLTPAHCQMIAATFSTTTHLLKPQMKDRYNEISKAVRAKNGMARVEAIRASYDGTTAEAAAQERVEPEAQIATRAEQSAPRGQQSNPPARVMCPICGKWWLRLRTPACGGGP